MDRQTDSRFVAQVGHNSLDLRLSASAFPAAATTGTHILHMSLSIAHKIACGDGCTTLSTALTNEPCKWVTMCGVSYISIKQIQNTAQRKDEASPLKRPNTERGHRQRKPLSLAQPAQSSARENPVTGRRNPPPQRGPEPDSYSTANKDKREGSWATSCCGKASPNPMPTEASKGSAQREASLPRTPARDKLVGGPYHAQDKETGHKRQQCLG